MTSRETYLLWLRYALWGGDSPVKDGFPANDDMLSMANCQKTRGLIFEALLREAGPDAGITAETAARMKQFLLKIFATHRMLDTALARAVAALQEAGIPAVLLKGQGVARNYPNPQLRECGDIDLFIGPERLAEAVRTLTPLADKVDEEILGKHWQLWIGRAEIELHLHSMIPECRREARFYQQIEAEGTSRGLVPLDFGGVRVDTPEPTFNALYIFYHAWHHFIRSGIGLRQLCDWALHLHVQRERIDPERLRAMLKGMHLLRAWQLFGCIAVHDLGLPQEELPCYSEARYGKSRRVLAMILAEGNFGQSRQRRRERPKGYVAGKIYALSGMIGRFFKMLPVAPRGATQIFVSLFARGFRRVFKDLFKR